jgi:hypothetical protein
LFRNRWLQTSTGGEDSAPLSSIIGDGWKLRFSITEDLLDLKTIHLTSTGKTFSHKWIGASTKLFYGGINMG